MQIASDPASERRFQTLKRRLDALHYCQPLTIESAALCEKLLNDLLKTTEGFQKLKKMNDELKHQKTDDLQYQEPLRKENEKVVRENNELHQQLIKFKEESMVQRSQLLHKTKQLMSEKEDLMFLSSQNQAKIQEMDNELMSLRKRLEKALQKTFDPNSTNILNGTDRHGGGQFSKAQEFSVSQTLGGHGENQDPNAGGHGSQAFAQFQSQQEVWAEELRRADDRCNKFKGDLNSLQAEKHSLELNLNDMTEKLMLRDQEIGRLQLASQGGANLQNIKQTYDRQQSEELIAKYERDLHFLNSQNQSLLKESNEIKELLGICESKDPTDRDRVHLKTLVRKLKTRNDTLSDQNGELQRIVDSLRSGNYKDSEGALIITNEAQDRLRHEIEATKVEVEQLKKENATLRVDAERSHQYQSAYQSNSKAITEKMGTFNQEVKEKDSQIGSLSTRLNQVELENNSLKEENAMYKGRTTSLARDVDLHYNQMHKIKGDESTATEQMKIMQERCQNLEEDFEGMRKQKNDAQLETRRIIQQNEVLEKELMQHRTHSMKAQGDNNSSSATVQRLTTQINGKQNDIELLMSQKNALEKELKASRDQVICAEKRADERYKQLVATKENLDILTNEQMILSEELTTKQNEVLKSEKEKISIERELLHLRPLKESLQQFSDCQQKQISDITKSEFEKQKLTQKIRELETQLTIAKEDTQELNLSYQQQVAEKNSLMRQLTLFEKDSYEIQARVKRGIDAERENETQHKTVESMKDSQRDLQRQFEKKETEISLKSNENDRLSQKIETMKSYQTTMETELSRLREQISTLNIEINSKDDETVKKENMKNKAELQIVDLQQSSRLLKDEKIRLTNENATLQKDLTQEQTKNQNLNTQLERMRSLVENLDQTKDELLNRLQNTMTDKRGGESEKAVLVNDIGTYKRELLMKDQQINDLKQSVAMLDSNLDDMQQELDQKTEELVQSKQHLERQCLEFSNVQHQISVVTGKEDNFQRKLFERESEIKHLRSETQMLREQVDQQTQLAQLKAQEVGELTEDIQTLTRENRFVNSEFGKSSHANEILKQQSTELADRERKAQQASRALELEKEDILQNYRESCNQSERLQQTVESISMENKELYNQIQLIQKDIGGASFAIQEFEKKEENYVQEILTLERHIDHVTRQVEEGQKTTNLVAQERDQIQNELNSFKGISMNEQKTKTDMQRCISSYENDKHLLNQQITDLANENTNLKSQLSFEQSKYNELEQVIQNERSGLHDYESQISQLKRANEDLNVEAERHKLRVESLQKHIENFQKHGGSVSNTSLLIVGSQSPHSHHQANSSSHRAISSHQIRTSPSKHAIVNHHITSHQENSQAAIGENMSQSAADKDAETETVKQENEHVKLENEQLRKYLEQYEQQIKDMESELSNLK